MHCPTKLSFEKMRTFVRNGCFTPPSDIFDKRNSIIDGEPYPLLTLFNHALIGVHLFVLVIVSIRSFWFEEWLLLLRLFFLRKRPSAWLERDYRVLIWSRQPLKILIIYWGGCYIPSWCHRGSIRSTQVSQPLHLSLSEHLTFKIYLQPSMYQFKFRYDLK